MSSGRKADEVEEGTVQGKAVVDVVQSHAAALNAEERTALFTAVIERGDWIEAVASLYQRTKEYATACSVSARTGRLTCW